MTKLTYACMWSGASYIWCTPDRLNEVAGANDVWSEQARGINVCQKVMHLCSIDSVKNVLFLPWICSNEPEVCM